MLKSAAVFSDHMVLQCMKPIPVWGWAGAEKEVTAELGEDTVTVRADRTGYFMAVLPPRPVGRGCTLTLSSENETIRFTDVAIGEVWYAGGQSNMELMLAESLEGERAVAESGCEDIRFYMTPKCAVTGPELEEASFRSDARKDVERLQVLAANQAVDVIICPRKDIMESYAAYGYLTDLTEVLPQEAAETAENEDRLLVTPGMLWTDEISFEDHESGQGPALPYIYDLSGKTAWEDLAGDGTECYLGVVLDSPHEEMAEELITALAG